jgi:beta-lactamase regulating signal transducer with metallopeptidase domain
MLNRIIQGVSQRFKCAILTLAVLLPYVGIAITPVFPAKMTADIHTALYYPAIQTTAVDNAGETVTMTENAPSVTTEEHQDVSIDIAGIVAWLWFAGTAIMLTFSVIRYVRLNAALHSCRQATNTIGRIKVYSVSMSISPFLIGLFRPAIYIPANIYNNDELELVTAHEATHYRRGDLYLRLIIMFLNCVNWFSPLYHHVLK